MSKATGPTYGVPFRRRRKRLTNYRKRLAFVKSGLARLVIRKSQQHITAQLVKFGPTGDMTVASAHSRELKKFGWVPQSNLPSAYLTAMLAGKKAKANGIDAFVLDMGLATATKNSIPFAAARGAIDSGLKSSVDSNVVDMARVRGEHIAKWAGMKKDGHDKIFSRYLKAGISPEKIPEKFDEVKKAIMGANVKAAAKSGGGV